MHDWTTFIQIVGPIVISLITIYCNNKKNDRDYIEEQNDRLNQENKQLKEEIQGLRKEIDKHDNK